MLTHTFIDELPRPQSQVPFREKKMNFDGPIRSLSDRFGWRVGCRDDDLHNKFTKEALEDTNSDVVTVFAINFVKE